jgi:hypothetical protein
MLPRSLNQSNFTSDAEDEGVERDMLCKTRPCLGLLIAYSAWDNDDMKLTSLPQPHEQRKIEKLLARLAKTKPISAGPAPIMSGVTAPRTA